MNKFLTFLIGALLGAVVGGALIFYLFVGAPRAAKAPGEPIKAPDANGQPAGTAMIVLKQDFLNEVLKTIFRDLNAPAFPLNLTGQSNLRDPNIISSALQQDGGCDNKIVLKPEGSGVNTGVSFENGNILAPLAFAGTYNVPLAGCTNFTGWAEANLELRYDEAQQAVFGQVNVNTVNLDGITPIASGFVTPLVQSTLNNRVNPIPILRGEQIALKLPIQMVNGTLDARVKDVRAEVKETNLNLYVIYDFAGVKQ
jgi:hypothetical protein